MRVWCLPRAMHGLYMHDLQPEMVNTCEHIHTHQAASCCLVFLPWRATVRCASCPGLVFIRAARGGHHRGMVVHVLLGSRLPLAPLRLSGKGLVHQLPFLGAPLRVLVWGIAARHFLVDLPRLGKHFLHQLPPSDGPLFGPACVLVLKHVLDTVLSHLLL